jgi:transposase
MIATDAQVKGFLRYMDQDPCLTRSAMKAGLCENTARKYLRSKILPSERPVQHTWSTRKNPFAGVWSEIEPLVRKNPTIQAKTIFQDLQDRYPGKFRDSQLRTLQRRIKHWRLRHGPEKEVDFPQIHYPGRLCASDFTEMDSLKITIQGKPFAHMVYHFVLTYSNWEDATLCYSESFESLSTGLQNAVHLCGGSTEYHRTDSLSAAVNNLDEKKAFTRRYQGLLSHYGTKGHHTNPGKGKENGDVEQRHHRFKDAVDQALMLRSSRDFSSIEQYQEFLRRLLDRLNAPRQALFHEEQKHLRPLPSCRLPDWRNLEDVLVNSDSTVRILKNSYSVPSRLIGSHVQIRVYADQIEVYTGYDRMDSFPRLRGKNRHQINYRHVIEWLVRKPGAFEHYRFQDAMFPSSQFRIAYDILRAEVPAKAVSEYLTILHHAALESEELVEEALRMIIRDNGVLNAAAVKALVSWLQGSPAEVLEPQIAPVALEEYDTLLTGEEAIV